MIGQLNGQAERWAQLVRQHDVIVAPWRLENHQILSVSRSSSLFWNLAPSRILKAARLGFQVPKFQSSFPDLHWHLTTRVYLQLSRCGPQVMAGIHLITVIRYAWHSKITTVDIEIGDSELGEDLVVHKGTFWRDLLNINNRPSPSLSSIDQPYLVVGQPQSSLLLLTLSP